MKRPNQPTEGLPAKLTKRKRRLKFARNHDRADWAQIALDAFLTQVGSCGSTTECKATDIGDLLGDLMHLCDRDGIDFDAALQSGRWHYEYEQERED